MRGGTVMYPLPLVEIDSQGLDVETLTEQLQASGITGVTFSQGRAYATFPEGTDLELATASVLQTQQKVM